MFKLFVLDYDAGVLQQLVKNLQLKATIAWIGADNAVEFLKNASRSLKPLVFYGWEPDLLLGLLNTEQRSGLEDKQVNTTLWSRKDYGFSRIFFPDHDSNEWMMSQGDETGPIASDFPTNSIMKIVWAKLHDFAPRIVNFVQRVSMTNEQMHELLAMHIDGGGVYNVQDTACTWIKNHSVIWKTWLTKSHECSYTDLEFMVHLCDSVSLTKHIEYRWKQPKRCNHGITLPTKIYVDCDHIPWDSLIARVMLGVSGSIVVLVLLSGLWISFVLLRRSCKYTNLNIILSRSQPPLLFLLFFGMTALIASSLFVIGPVSKTQCTTQISMANFAYILTYSAIFLKEYRIWQSYNSRIMIITGKVALQLVAPVFILEIVLLIAAVTFDPPQEKTGILVHPGASWTVIDTCVGRHGTIFVIVMLLKVLWTLYGTILATKTRNYCDDANESKSLWLSTLFALLCFIIYSLLVFSTGRNMLDASYILPQYTVLESQWQTVPFTNAIEVEELISKSKGSINVKWVSLWFSLARYLLLNFGVLIILMCMVFPKLYIAYRERRGLPINIYSGKRGAKTDPQEDGSSSQDPVESADTMALDGIDSPRTRIDSIRIRTIVPILTNPITRLYFRKYLESNYCAEK